MKSEYSEAPGLCEGMCVCVCFMRFGGWLQGVCGYTKGRGAGARGTATATEALRLEAPQLAQLRVYSGYRPCLKPLA